MKIYVLLIAFAFNTNILFGLQSNIKVGEYLKIKEFNLTALNGIQIDTSKLIVLDFWATWCAPCIAAFPHLDSLQKKYSNTLQIICPTDEPKETAEKFLKNKKYSLSFFNDTNNELFKLFQIEARPLTCLLSEKGKLLWIGHSNDLSKVIDTYLNSKSIIYQTAKDLLLEKYYTAQISKGEEIGPFFQYKIEIQGDHGNYFVKSQKNKDSKVDIHYSETPVSEMLQDLLEIPKMRFSSNRPDLDTVLIGITAKSSLPDFTYGVVSKIILKDLQKIFSFNIKEQIKTVSVYEMKISDQTKLDQYEEKIEGGGQIQTEGDKILVTRLSLHQVSSYFEMKTRKFLNFSGENNLKYNLVFDKYETIDELNIQLSNKYGISLESKEANLLFVEIN